MNFEDGRIFFITVREWSTNIPTTGSRVESLLTNSIQKGVDIRKVRGDPLREGIGSIFL